MYRATPTVAKDESVPRPPDAGVSLEVVRALMDAVSPHTTTEELCEALRLLTAEAGGKLSGASLLDPGHVGPPRAFVSHMWGAPFHQAAAAVLERYHYEELDPDQRQGVKVRGAAYSVAVVGFVTATVTATMRSWT